MTAPVATQARECDHLRPRRQLVADILHMALAEQSRICVIDGIVFPRANELFGRDLSMLTVVETDPRLAAELRERFDDRIVIEGSPPNVFFERFQNRNERFDLVVIPMLADALSDAAVSALLLNIIGCLRRGGRFSVVGNTSDDNACVKGRTLGKLMQLIENLKGSAGPLHLSGRTCGTLGLVEAKLADA